jgi:hypothetical protein
MSIPRSLLPICVRISYSRAFRPHLSTGEDMICWTGRMSGSFRRDGDWRAHDDSAVDGGPPADGMCGLDDGVADVDWDALGPFNDAWGDPGCADPCLSMLIIWERRVNKAHVKVTAAAAHTLWSLSPNAGKSSRKPSDPEPPLGCWEEDPGPASPGGGGSMLESICPGGCWCRKSC